MMNSQAVFTVSIIFINMCQSRYLLVDLKSDSETSRDQQYVKNHGNIHTKTLLEQDMEKLSAYQNIGNFSEEMVHVGDILFTKRQYEEYMGNGSTNSRAGQMIMNLSLLWNSEYKEKPLKIPYIILPEINPDFGGPWKKSDPQYPRIRGNVKQTIQEFNKRFDINCLSLVEYGFEGEWEESYFPTYHIVILIAKPGANNPSCDSMIGKRADTENLHERITWMHVSADNPFPYNCIHHELLHALGLNHEMIRSDRDLYLDIHWENIEPEYKHNFMLPKDEYLYSWGVSFNFESIMMYSPCDFSKPGRCPTISKKGDPSYTWVPSLTMLEGDIEKIRDGYGCKHP